MSDIKSKRGDANEQLPLLNQLRGIAIICVFAYHTLYQVFSRDELDWNAWTRKFEGPPAFFALYPVTWGWCGVAIFFVISGFCIHLSYIKSGRLFGPFFVRRFFRIYPAYFVALIFFACIFPRTRLNFLSRWGEGQFIAHLLLLHNLNAQTVHGIATAWWSIAVEFQLYLLYPVLMFVVVRLGWRRVMLMTASIELALRLVAAVLSLFSVGVPIWMTNSPFYFWFSWAIGAGIAEAYLRGEPLPFVHISPWAWGLLFVAADLFKPLTTFSFTIVALGTASFLSRCLAKGLLELRLPPALSRHITLIGLTSYSVYLLHHPFVEAWPRIISAILPREITVEPAAAFLVFCAAWLLIFPLSRILYLGVERPAVGFSKKLLTSRADMISLNRA